jgi:hypothetical protein
MIVVKKVPSPLAPLEKTADSFPVNTMRCLVLTSFYDGVGDKEYTSGEIVSVDIKTFKRFGPNFETEH